MKAPRFYVDPSVIAGVILGDLDGFTSSVLRDATALVYSDFGLGEVVSAISARIRAVHGSDELGAAKIEAMRLYLDRWQRELLISSDLLTATDFVGRPSLALKLPDAIHIAIARRIGLPLLTNDRQQQAAATALHLATASTL